ncbi:uncharacterized protein CCR75_008296 [Bremia lactucae]|uniref:Uncharacterized protein n=1 Tax=Bremia lactucae TaxID=4779 RepID=A0A976IJ93_BRELC|nr:hypothetical protein CCR75_008296 [Bremia lactucae]
MTSAELQFLVHFNQTLCVSLSPNIATVSSILVLIQQFEGVPHSLLDLYVNGRKLDVFSHVPSFPTIIRARLRGGLRGGKGGFGAMLRSMGKASGGRTTTNFGACRDLHGRRLRHVNQEVAMLKWHQEAEDRKKNDNNAFEDREVLDEETPSGIPGWYLATPSWAEGIKKSYMKRRRNTVLCRSWLKAREGGCIPPSGAPRWWGCPRGRDCDFAHGEEELRGGSLTELKRAKSETDQQAKQNQLQEYVDFEQEMPEDVMDAIMNGLRRRKKKTEVPRIQQEFHASVLIPDASSYICVRSVRHSVPVVKKWLKLVGSEEGDGSVTTTFQHGLCELRGRGNFGTAAMRHCCALTQGKWYYEVRLVTAGVVQLGWADSTLEANSATGDGVGDHERSWAYDGARRVKWNGGKDEEYGSDDSWSKNDVIGCLLDLNEGTVAFTRNGVDLGVAFRNVKHMSSDRGLFPAISVEQTEIMLINIGSQPFVYEARGFDPVIEALDAEELGGFDNNASVKSYGSYISNDEVSCTVGLDTTKKQIEASVLESVKTDTPKGPQTEATTTTPIDLLKFKTIASLEALGLEKLKVELSRRGLKCGGNLTERAARLLTVRGKAWDEIDAKIKAKKRLWM